MKIKTLGVLGFFLTQPLLATTLKCETVEYIKRPAQILTTRLTVNTLTGTFEFKERREGMLSSRKFIKLGKLKCSDEALPFVDCKSNDAGASTDGYKVLAYGPGNRLDINDWSGVKAQVETLGDQSEADEVQFRVKLSGRYGQEIKEDIKFLINDCQVQ